MNASNRDAPTGWTADEAARLARLTPADRDALQLYYLRAWLARKRRAAFAAAMARDPEHLDRSRWAPRLA